ncbi:hypothetical protein UP10_15575 [Bradyrhizobium sp. LTSPM299]|uniref:hypothetical protein n=1 Tax=Bradyrhizobium sp. LTSPM299 TaxID=1619233 RepID=UPI0005CA789F|nr:hypothetical protein [Bradyrhizobium sp. LTSPM299]KJC60082.1 hypothetical protein UP10_15575 [Bradyrhizobium sp. LTSPM299]
MADALRLALTTFPQHWDGKGTLTLNVVVIPAVDPLPGSLIGPSSPSFANGAPTFTVIVNKGLGALPVSTGANAIALSPTILSAPASPAATFALLQSSVTASGATLGTQPILAIPRIRKSLPPSYLAVGGGPPDGNLTTTDDEFGCAVRGNPAKPIPAAPLKTVSWGQVISYALRQPILAEKLGLIYQLSITLPANDADAFVAGGYVFVALAASDPWAVAGAAVAGSIRTHAARIPPLSAAARALFAPVEFPVDGAGGAPSDSAFQVADVYADGFAKLVHCAQPANSAAAVGDGLLAPGNDLGIELGWDDEQVVRWHNDQLALLSARTGGTLGSATQTPLGVQGYRVDVADVTPAVQGGPFKTPLWQSLCKVTTKLPSSLGTFTGELCVEPAPTQPFSTTPADAWLPRYFANWRGGSLCEPDPIPQALTTRTAPGIPTRTAVDLTTLLSYGHIYSFRVRLGDLSSGGPGVSDAAINPGPASIATLPFQRLVPPKAPLVQQLDSNGKPIVPAPGAASAPASLLVKRPNIIYPEALYTHLGDQPASRDTIRATLVTTAKTTKGIAGLPDPDVTAVSIEVAIRHPLHDTGTEDGPYVTLYTTSRALNPTTGSPPLASDPGTKISVIFIDEPSIVNWSPIGQPVTGALLIPRGRDVRITLRGMLRTDEPGYFGPQAAQAMATTIQVRVGPTAEPVLLGQADADEPITAYLFRRPADVAAPSLVSQLAEQLGVMANGNSLSAPPGTRIVFGGSRALRAIISADGETLTFGSTSELLRFWIVAIILDLERDWTWDGLTDAGLTILRGGPADGEAAAVAVGTVAIPRVLGTAATAQPSALARSRTRLIFFDAIDPHEPVSGGFPQSLQHRWFVKPNRIAAGPPLPPSPPTPVFTTPPPPLPTTEFADAPLDLRLPIAIPPKQVPAIASVGLALSPYVAGALYASTVARQRSLWIELTEPIANADGDALFARVLNHGADPLLYDAKPQVVADSNPPLPLDPELVRVIIPDDTDDRAGLNAMTELVAAPGSNVHFLLPLPNGMDPDDPELFGFWTYELRIGHAGKPGDLRWWSTANARFGSPMRVVGVQHPSPALVCHAGRVNLPAGSAAAVLSAMTAAACPFQLQQIMPPLVPPVTASKGTPSLVVATAPYATPMLNGSFLVTPRQPPHTSMWFLLYAQAVQADGASMRNVLIASEPGVFVNRALDTIDPALRPYFTTLVASSLKSKTPNRTAVVAFHQAQIEAILASVHLPTSSSLSIIAVEMLPGGTSSVTQDFAGVATDTIAARGNASFPFGRILRASPLAPIAPFC